MAAALEARSWAGIALLLDEAGSVTVPPCSPRRPGRRTRARRRGFGNSLDSAPASLPRGLVPFVPRRPSHFIPRARRTLRSEQGSNFFRGMVWSMVGSRPKGVGGMVLPAQD